MPRSSHLEPHLTAAELHTRFRAARAADVKQRWQVLWLVATGTPATRAATLAGLNERSARRILARYNTRGPAAMEPPRRKTGGRAALLDDAGRAALATALRSPAPDGGVWTGPAVARWIAARIGRAFVLPRVGWTYLRRAGFTLRRPRPRHARADPAAQDAFKKKGSPPRSRPSGTRTPTR